jgi:hypothetical protein
MLRENIAAVSENLATLSEKLGLGLDNFSLSWSIFKLLFPFKAPIAVQFHLEKSVASWMEQIKRQLNMFIV